MSVVNGKRITFKRTRPNPLFHDWLEELYEEAKQKGSKLEPMLQEALSSISKYPLPLQSGSECAILKGFDKRLCLFIDKRLDVYKSNESSLSTCSKSTTNDLSDDENDIIPVINAQSSSESISPCIASSSSSECDKNLPSSPIKNRKKRIYKPAFRSGSYAFLMVLMELKKNQSMSKGQLTAAAQKYCDKDISSEWKSMTALLRRGLVKKSIENNIPRFFLTDEGISVAKELFSSAHENKGVEDIIMNAYLSNHDNENKCNQVNDLVCNDNKCSEVVAVINDTKAASISNGLVHDKCECETNNKIYEENKCSEVIVINDKEAKSITYDSQYGDKSISEVNDLLHDKNKCTNEVIVINDRKAATVTNNILPNDAGILSNDKSLYSEDNIENVVNHVDYSNCVEMAPGCFDIILLIDKHETNGMAKKNDPTVTQFNKYPELKHEYRCLKVGDFTWIARHKTYKDQELVLPYVVERKRMDDLGHSIKDGRFHEQKFRLRKCGLNHVIYMVENHGSNKHVGLPMQSLMQALANTRVQDDFKVHITESLENSVRFLATMTLRLMYEYKDKGLKGHNGEPKGDILMTFGHFNKSSVKNRALSVTETFIKLLLQLKGVSVEKALTITNVYKTPRMLIEKYKSCDQKEGEMLLANLKFGELNRSIGPIVSKSVYQLFTFTNMK